MSIYFARHGQTDWNTLRKMQGTTDIPLNEKGIEQANHLCQIIIDEKIQLSRIYTSYQSRALRTAQIIGDRLGIDYAILNGLEEMNLGDFEGHTPEEINRLYPEEVKRWNRNKRYNPAPNGESYQMVLERLFHALEHVIDFDSEEQQENLLMISHGAVIMTLIALKNDIPFEQSYTLKRVENAKPIEFSLADLKEIRKKL